MRLSVTVTETIGLYYKNIAIVHDNTSQQWVKPQFGASLTVIYYAPRVINYALREHYSTAITNDDRNKFIVQTNEVATFLFSWKFPATIVDCIQWGRGGGMHAWFSLIPCLWTVIKTEQSLRRQSPLHEPVLYNCNFYHIVIMVVFSIAICFHPSLLLTGKAWAHQRGVPGGCIVFLLILRL